MVAYPLEYFEIPNKLLSLANHSNVLPLTGIYDDRNKNTHDDRNKNLQTTNTLDTAQELDSHHENVDNVDRIKNESISDEPRISVDQLLVPQCSYQKKDLNTHEDDNKNLQTSDTSEVVQQQNTQHKNVDNVDIDIDNESISGETRIAAEQLLIDSRTADGVELHDGDHIGIEDENVSDETRVSVEQLSVLGSSHRKEGASKKRKLENVAVIREQVPGSTELWKWEKISIVHREKFINLREYGKTHSKKIKDVGAVRFCCMKQFLIGKGNDGTRVYIGLGKDGYERAVKCLPKDALAGDFAEKEKELLNEPNAKKSNHVINYYFFDDESDEEYFFLIMDLCEETLETFVHDSSLDDLVTIAPKIIKQVLIGLADLHRDPKPILHRDVKPANVLRDVHGDWLLADFGISRLLAGGATTHQSKPMGTEDWIAVESHPSNPNLCKTDDGTVRYKKKSDIQAVGMVAVYLVTKGEHPFEERRYRLDNLLDGKPVGLDTLEDPVLKDLLSWMLSHDPKDRPSAEQALKHPYLQPKEKWFEMLCKMGNQEEIKTGDSSSDVVRELNNDPTNWKTRIKPDVLKYLCTDFINGKPKTFSYKSSWTECLRFIRNVNQHWHDRPRPMPQPEAFYVVSDPQEYILNLFPNLPAKLHRIVRSCDWKERPDLKEYFTKDYIDVLYTTHVDYGKVSSCQKASTLQVRETNRKHTELHEQFTWFKATFLDSKRKLKKEIHKELKSFPWLCGAYGITGPNKKIPRLHLFLTVKRGVKKTVVRRDLEDKFNCHPKEYFELLQEPLNVQNTRCLKTIY